MESDSSRKQVFVVGYIFMAGVAVLLLQWAFMTINSVETIPFSQFDRLVSRGDVTEVIVGSDTIQGKLKEKLPSGKSAFATARVEMLPWRNAEIRIQRPESRCRRILPR